MHIVHCFPFWVIQVHVILLEKRRRTRAHPTCPTFSPRMRSGGGRIASTVVRGWQQQPTQKAIEKAKADSKKHTR